MPGLFSKTSLLTLVLYMVLVLGSAAAGYMAADVYIENNLINPFGNPGERESNIEVPGEEEDILNVLLMGIGSTDTGLRADTGDRTDSIMLLRYNPNTDDVGLVSIPRDTRVKLPDRGREKINHAYVYGGTEYLINTVEEFLDIPIHYYVAVNMTGFKNAMNILGGLDITVEERMYHEVQMNGEAVAVIDLHPGTELTTGDKVLQYVRWRGGPDADLGRIERQQKVIRATVDELLKFDSVMKINELLKEALTHIDTNFTLSDLLSYARAFYKIDWGEMRTTTLPGENEKNDLWYYVVDKEEARAIVRTVIEVEEE